MKYFIWKRTTGELLQCDLSDDWIYSKMNEAQLLSNIKKQILFDQTIHWISQIKDYYVGFIQDE